MADEPRRDDESQANGHATAVATEPAKPLPPGVVLGPDGKPYVGSWSLSWIWSLQHS